MSSRAAARILPTALEFRCTSPGHFSEKLRERFQTSRVSSARHGLHKMSATAARRRAVNTRRLPARATVAALWVLLLVRAASGADTPDAPAGDSSTEINRKVTNPLSTTWSFKVINK